MERILDKKRILRQKPFFALAEILAILSGTWIVGASMYQLFSSNLFAIYRIQANVLARLVNNTSFTSATSAAALSNGITAYGSCVFIFLFVMGLLFAVCAVVAWCFGSMMKK